MNNTNKVEITVKNVYGIDRIFPVNETAKLFALLIARKTFDNSHLDLMKKLGYEVSQITEKITL